MPFVLLVGSYLFLGGTIASELLVAFMLMSLALSALLIAFEHSYNLLKELKLATSNLEQAFDTKPLSYKEEKVKLSHFDITFENVTQYQFSCPGGKHYGADRAVRLRQIYGC